jgi:hypothetical protein
MRDHRGRLIVIGSAMTGMTERMGFVERGSDSLTAGTMLASRGSCLLRGACARLMSASRAASGRMGLLR